jgi:HIV Tat-specific factor 1
MSLRNPDDKPRTEPAQDEQQSSGGFPQDPSEFDSDPRISFSKVNNKFILETEDDREFEYDAALKRWVQTVRYCPSGGAFLREPFFPRLGILC